MKVLIASLNNERFPDPVYPLGADYIAHYAHLSGHEVETFDALFSDEPVHEIKAKITAFQPEVIGFSLRNVDNTNYLNFKNFSDHYRSIVSTSRGHCDAILVVGGSAFSVFPIEYMDWLKPDYGIVGEGENAFAELLNSIENRRAPKEKIIYGRNSVNLDHSAYSDRNYFDNDYYYQYSGGINIQTKRGCSFRCSYCTYPKIEGYQYRYRPPSQVVDEIAHWETMGFNYFFFVDSVFNQPEKYATQICREIIKRNLNIHWTGFFMPRIQDESFVALCKESGLTSMDLGTDALSAQTIKSYQKAFTIEDVMLCCEWCSKYDIKFNHSLILGGPGETYQTLDETIGNVNRTDPVSVIAYLGVRIFPGTPIYDAYNFGKITFDPSFYLSEHVSEGVVEFLKSKIGNHPRWIIPGVLDKDQKVMEKLRQKNKKGPLWELIR